MDGLIDVHSHLPIGAVTAPLGSPGLAGRTPAGPGLAGPAFAGPALADAGRPAARPWIPTGAIEAMDRHGIATQMLSLPHMFVPGPHDERPAAQSARAVNERFAAIVGDHPDRFGAFACLPADTPDAALAELEHALDVLHLDGVAVTSNTQGRYLGHPFFEPVLAELDRRRTPIFVHPTNPPHVRDLALGRPPFLVEFPFDTTRTLIDAIYAGVFVRHSRLRVIVAHCGGALPALAWRVTSLAAIGQSSDAPQVTADDVASALRGLFYDTALCGSASSIVPTIELAGVGQLLYGSDSGAASDEVIATNLTGLRALGLGPEQLRSISRLNALELFPRLA